MTRIESILMLLKQAKDEDLMLSRLNCHVKGLHSIVLSNDCGRLTRLFLTTPKHRMYLNDKQDLVVRLGIHSHRYHLYLTGIHGEAQNIIYRPCKSGMGVKVKSYKFFDRESFEFNGVKEVRKFSANPVADRIIMYKDELHTVNVNKNETASWLVEEGVEQRQHTMLYTNSEVSCSNYQSFKCPENVRRYVHSYYKSFGNLEIY